MCLCVLTLHTLIHAFYIRTDMGLQSMYTRMAKATEEYKSFEKQCEDKLTVNRAEQRDLENLRHLAKLREEEQELVKEIKIVKYLQMNADTAKEVAEREIKEWRGKIEELSRRTETALQVREEMKSKSSIPHSLL